MRRIIYVLFILSIVFIIGCDENTNVEKNENETMESYIKNLIDEDANQPYLGEYYLYANFTDKVTLESKELYLNINDHKLSKLIVMDNGLGMSVRGISLMDSVTHEELEIAFYTNVKNETTFNIYNANYYYANPWYNKEGVQFSYFIPVSISDPNTQYRYLGSNTPNSYFKIIYIDEDRINGNFKTLWEECCGGNKKYDVYGDFSVPIDKFWNINL